MYCAVQSYVNVRKTDKLRRCIRGIELASPSGGNSPLHLNNMESKSLTGEVQ